MSAPPTAAAERRQIPDGNTAAPAADGRPGSAFGLERGDRRFLTVASLVTFLLMAAHWWRIMGWSPASVEIDRPAGEDYRFVLDVNTATWVEWMQLEGIGEILARRIVADREQYGPFPSVDAVQRVPGIGPKTLKRMRPHLTVIAPASGGRQSGEPGTSVP